MKKILLITTSVAMALSMTVTANEKPAQFEGDRFDGAEFTPRITTNTSKAKLPVRNVMTPSMPATSRPTYDGNGEPVFQLPIFSNAKTVNYSFPVVAGQKMDFSAKKAHSQSREYNMVVTGNQLHQGVSLKATAPGALVRISSFNGNSAVEPQNLTLTVNNQKFDNGSAFDTLVDSNMMQKTGVGFQRGTTGFKISEQVGKGNFNLKTTQAMGTNDRFLVNVFEKNSDTELHLTANKSAYLKGNRLSVAADVWSQGKKHSLNRITAKLVSPAGQKYPVNINKAGQVNMPLHMAANQIPGALWTLETEVEANVNGQLVKRIGRVAFAYAERTASMMGSTPAVLQNKNGLTAIIPVQANTAGRYEIRAVLYGTNSKGQMMPAMATHSARQMSAGLGMLNMQFDQKLLSASGLQAPFELRNIQLRDQTKMALLQVK